MERKKIFAYLIYRYRYSNIYADVYCGCVNICSNAITYRALGSNPLYCDCHLQWLAEWVKKDFVEPGIAKCAEPAYMKDKLILNTPVSAFQCKGEDTYTCIREM